MDLTLVDAFTHQPFTGNPAAVAVLDTFPAPARMQMVANELNLSETAFVVRRSDGDYDLRWFTPRVEVDLCGHATLAAAHVLGGTVRFHTRSGVLACAEGAAGRIEMDFPLDRPTAASVPSSLGVAGVTWYGRGRFDVLIVLQHGDDVRTFEPDLAALASLGSRAVIVTAPGGAAGVDCVSRVFAPNAGIPEDPVTGSAHCTLAAYWGERTGRTELVGMQLSGRGGTVHMRRTDDRVVLGGHAIIVGRILLTA